MAEFHRICSIHDVPDPGKACFEVEDRFVVLIHQDGKFTCLDDICTHDGGPLAEGELEGSSLVCPRHGAKFDIINGSALSLPAMQATAVHEVKVEGEDISIRIYEEGKTMPEEDKEKLAGNPTEESSEGLNENVPVEPEQAGSEGESQSSLENLVEEALKTVIDPELFVNIVDLGLIYGVAFESADENSYNVKIAMTMTSPACPAGPQLIAGVNNSVGQVPSVQEVEVKIVMEPPWTPDRMTEDARDQLGIF